MVFTFVVSDKIVNVPAISTYAVVIVVRPVSFFKITSGTVNLVIYAVIRVRDNVLMSANGTCAVFAVKVVRSDSAVFDFPA